MVSSSLIIVYEEADKDSIDKHVASLGNYELKSYKEFPIADAMVHFLIGLEREYDHAYVLIGKGQNSRNWLSKEIRLGHSANKYEKITPIFITDSQVPVWWRGIESLKYLNDINN